MEERILEDLRIYIFENSLPKITHLDEKIINWIDRISLPFLGRTIVKSVKITLIQENIDDDHGKEITAIRFVNELLERIPRLDTKDYAFQTLYKGHLSSELYFIRRKEDHCVFILSETDLLENQSSQNFIGKVYWRVLESDDPSRVVNYWDIDTALPVDPNVIAQVSEKIVTNKKQFDNKIKLFQIFKYIIGILGSILFFGILGGDMLSVFRYALSIFNWGHSSISFIILTITFWATTQIECKTKNIEQSIDTM